MKRQLSLEQFRDVVCSRLIKGTAFILSNDEYLLNQEKVKKELSMMTKEDIALKYPHACYNIK